MTKLLLLDLDGTVREPVSGAKFINEPKDQFIFLGARNAIDRYSATGWNVIGITNQGGVMHGHKSLKDCIAEQRYTMRLIPQLKRVYFCPDAGDTCYRVVRPLWLPTIATVLRFDGGMGDDPSHQLGGYRKPQPGMLRLAIQQLEPQIFQLTDTFYEPQPSIDGEEPLEVLYVGDRDEDEKAALSANVPFMWAKDWWVE